MAGRTLKFYGLIDRLAECRAHRWSIGYGYAHDLIRRQMETRKTGRCVNIAIPLEDMVIATGIERCGVFVRYEVDPTNGQVSRITMLEAPTGDIEERIGWLSERRVDWLLYRGVDSRLNEICSRRGIGVVSGFHTLEPRQAVGAYLAKWAFL